MPTRLDAPLRRRRLAALIVAAVAAISVPAAGTAAATGTEAAWAALRAGGHVALMRHATAPGTGDPAGFRLDDCATQRTLSADGRAEAERIGRAFRRQGIRVSGVFSSQWCRSLETARLLDLGPVEPLPALNSFFQDWEREAAQTAELRAFLARRPAAGALVLITHQVNITALTGLTPRSGETVVLRAGADGTTEVVGRIPPPG